MLPIWVHRSTWDVLLLLGPWTQCQRTERHVLQRRFAFTGPGTRADPGPDTSGADKKGKVVKSVAVVNPFCEAEQPAPDVQAPLQTAGTPNTGN